MSQDRARNVTTSWFSFNPPLTNLTVNYNPPASISGKRCDIKVEAMFLTDLTIDPTKMVPAVLGISSGLSFPYLTINDSANSDTTRFDCLAILGLQSPGYLMSPEVLCVVPNGPTNLTFTLNTPATIPNTSQLIVCISLRPIE